MVALRSRHRNTADQREVRHDDGLPVAAQGVPIAVPGTSAVNQTGRMEALSDGIFAIAMTLLVLDLKAPDISANQTLLAAIGDQWTSYLAFVIGFFTLLVCWINHHYMFEYIEEKDGPLMLLNGFKLLVVSFTPFATSLLARFINTGHEQAAVSFYAANFFLMGFAMTSLWCYASARGLTKPAQPGIIAAMTRLYQAATIISGAILLLSFISVWPAFAVFCAMFGIFVFPRGVAEAIAARRAVA